MIFFTYTYTTEEKNRNRVAIVNELMLTISNLLVRNEYCKKADDFGIFDLIFDSMTFHMNEEVTIYSKNLIHLSFSYG